MTHSRVDSSRLMPASYVQQGLWRVVRQSAPGETFLVRALRITGPVDVDRLGRAVREASAGLPALGLNLVERGDRLLLSSGATPGVLTHDLSSVAPPRRESDCVERLRADRDRETDAAREPLVRFHIVQLDPAQVVLGVVAHRLVLDEYSLHAVLQGVMEAYRGRFRRDAYLDLAELLAFYPLAEPVAANRRRWWASWLAECPQDTAGAAAGCECEAGRVVFDGGQWQSLARLGGALGDNGALSVAALIAWWLQRAAGRPGTAGIATMLDLRDYFDLGQAVGPLTDHIVFRVELDPSDTPSFREVLRATQVGILRSAARYLPYGELIDLGQQTGRIEQVRTAALWDVYVHLCRHPTTVGRRNEFLDLWLEPFREADLIGATAAVSPGWDGTNLDVRLGESAGGMALTVQVNRAQQGFTADQLLSGVSQAAAAAIADPDRPLEPTL